MNEYVFPADALTDLRRALLTHAPDEAAAVILAGVARDGGRTRLLVREMVLVPQQSCTVQTSARLVVSPAFLAPHLKRARNEGWSLILAHTHPFAHESVWFSTVDDEGERVIMPSIFGRAPDRPHGTLVLGTKQLAARVWQPGGEGSEPVARVVACGAHLRCIEENSGEAVISAVPAFDRSVRAFGREGQTTLQRMTIGVVGLGGTGSLVAQELAHLGVRQFLFIDHDDLDETSLNRVAGATGAHVGTPKVDVAARHVQAVRPDAKIRAIKGNVVDEHHARALLQADLIFGCTDSHGSRALLNQIAYQHMIPVIDMGVRIQVRTGTVESITGRVQMLAPGLPCLVCQGLLDPEEVRRDFLSEIERARDPYIIGATEPQPAVISLNGTIASLAVTMMLAAVVGLPSATRHQVLLGVRGIVRAVESAPQPECVVCSLRGAFGRGDLWSLPVRRA